MAKSRLALLAFALAAPASAWAQEPLTAEAAIDVQKRELQEAAGTAPCPRDEVGDEIVVCAGRGPDPNRLPFPDEQPPGARGVGLGTASDAMNAGTSPCSAVGPNQRCSGGLDLFRVGTVLFKIGKHLLGKDD